MFRGCHKQFVWKMLSNQLKEEDMKKVIALAALAILIAMPLAAVVQTQNVVVPYMLKAQAPIKVDGVLDEWSFSFPVEFNFAVMRPWMRFGTSQPLPADDEDCSGVIYQMYDDDNFYFAAKVKDDAPGHLSDASWASDCIEYYFANWEVPADAIFPPGETSAWVDDAATGQYSFQLNIALSVSQDSVLVTGYYGPGGAPGGDGSGAVECQAAYKLTDDGYILEGTIPLDALTSKKTGNAFAFPAGKRIPAAWSLYDIDETEMSADFKGYAYTKEGFAGWMGPGPGFQVIDVLPTARGTDTWNNECQFDFVAPYIKKVGPRSVQVDCDLSDWNFCFPVDFNFDVMNSSMRFGNSQPLPADDEDCSGTLYQMYDDNNFYFAAKVKDDAPGHFSDASWAADAIEFYMGNWDIGKDALISESTGSQQDDAATGNYSFQIAETFSVGLDSIAVTGYSGPGNPAGDGPIDGAEAKYKLTDDGYIIEGMVPIDALISKKGSNNIMAFIEGFRIPFTWSLYDVDESELSSEFKGYAYTKEGFAGWQGPGPGWEYCDVKGLDFIDALTEIYTGVEDKTVQIPQTLSLANAPNPFNPTTDIHFTLKSSGRTDLKIYSVSGRLVKTVFEGQSMNAGANRITVNMSELPSGCYVAVLEQGQQRITHKMALMK
jgi:hypothetical protein